MNRLRWSADAESDLDAITEYIARDNVLAAIEMRDEIEQRLALLSDHSEAGREGRVTGTREMVLAGTPYVAVYQIGRGQVVILRVLHGAQKWP